MSGPTNYQWVITSTNYDGTAAPKSLRFDGVDDYLNLPYMGLYAAGSASVVIARDEVLYSEAKYFVSERSTTAINPYYILDAVNANSYVVGSAISNDVGEFSANSLSPLLNVATNAVVHTHIDTGSKMSHIRNGVIANSVDYVRTGTVTVSNTIIGAYVTTYTSGFVNNKLYGLIITKSALTDSQRIACERHLSRKAGVIL